MKRLLPLIFTTFSFLVSFSQSPVDFSRFAITPNDTAALFTKDLLQAINWQLIRQFCSTAKGHYAFEQKDTFLTRYEYTKQGHEAFFDIVSYQGMVLEIHVDKGDTSQQRSISYFNKDLWLKYVSEMLPDLPEQFKLSRNEPGNILKAYYRLLGVNTEDEYGFICEYGTMGMATARRRSIIELICCDRFDLIKSLTAYPNLQTRLYAIDALLYKDYTTRHTARRLKQDPISYNNPMVMTDDLRKMISDLRNSNQTVRTCGNSGSYKIYETPISEVLSDKAIAAIPKRYEGLKKLGYFRR